MKITNINFKMRKNEKNKFKEIFKLIQIIFQLKIYAKKKLYHLIWFAHCWVCQIT